MKSAIIFGRTLIAVLVVYLFVIVLMTASIQQRASAQLIESRLPGSTLEYGSALVILREADDTLKNIKALEKQLSEQRNNVRQETELRDKIEAKRFVALEQFQIFAKEAERVPGCTLDPADNTHMEGRWFGLLACADRGILPRSLRDQVNNIRVANDNWYRFDYEWAVRNGDITAINNKGNDIKLELNEQKEQYAGSEKLRSIFSDITAMKQSLIFGNGVLITLPPSVVQLLLALFSGTFGALVINLVLIVYPGGKLSLATGTGYSARILLGGLVSVGVYVVLGGGAAVLGGAAPFDEAHANFKTFCAVGLLAGMASDRVASWLSDRASAFFPAGADKGQKERTADFVGRAGSE